MEERTEHDATLARYLLGSLPPAERDRIELQALADPVLFERLQVIEDDLIDAYVNAEMSEGDVTLFEENILSHPRRRERVEVARCLRTTVERAAQAQAAPPPRVRTGESVEKALASAEKETTWPWLAWAASLLVLILGGWLALQNLQLGERLHELQNERAAWTADQQAISEESQRLKEELATEKQRNAELNATLLAERERLAELEEQPQPEKSPAEIRPPVIVAFVLGMGVRGTEGIPRLTVPTSADRVDLQVDVETASATSTFRALIANNAGDEVWGVATLKPRDQALTLSLPAAVLPPGRYLLTLLENVDGEFEEVGFFEFEVV